VSWNDFEVGMPGEDQIEQVQGIFEEKSLRCVTRLPAAKQLPLCDVSKSENRTGRRLDGGYLMIRMIGNVRRNEVRKPTGKRLNGTGHRFADDSLRSWEIEKTTWNAANCSPPGARSSRLGCGVFLFEQGIF
jgi:hypothetical protein